MPSPPSSFGQQTDEGEVQAVCWHQHRITALLHGLCSQVLCIRAPVGLGYHGKGKKMANAVLPSTAQIPESCWSTPGSGLANGKLELAILARPELACTHTPKVHSTTVPAKCKGPTAPPAGTTSAWRSLRLQAEPLCPLRHPRAGGSLRGHSRWLPRSDVPRSHAGPASRPCLLNSGFFFSVSADHFLKAIIFPNIPFCKLSLERSGKGCFPLLPVPADPGTGQITSESHL